MTDIIVIAEPSFSPSIYVEIIGSANDYSIMTLVVRSAVEHAWGCELNSLQRTSSA